jgi:hypothetical protein
VPRRGHGFVRTVNESNWAGRQASVPVQRDQRSTGGSGSFKGRVERAGKPARLQGSRTSRGSRSASKRTRAAPSQPQRTGRSLTACCAISSNQPATAKRRHSSGTPFNS